VSKLRVKAEGSGDNPLWEDVLSWYMEKDEWKDRCTRALSGIDYTNSAEGIRPNRARELYGRQMYFSISRLEKYAECPFSYFLQYGLKARERKIFELSPPDLGSFIHSVLDSFSKLLEDENISWRELEKDWCAEKVSSIVDETVEKTPGFILSSSARYRYLKERLKKMIQRAVWLIALHIKKGGFNPAAHEAAFGGGGVYPPISIELQSGERINLMGRIDRVDTMEDDENIYVRIVDYKSGRKDFNLSDVYNGLELQLLTYMDAILEYSSRNSKKPVIPGGILYFRIDDPIIKGSADMSGEEIEKGIMKELRM
jgi:ATP-dependent helicase/nuclease subunit B